MSGQDSYYPAHAGPIVPDVTPNLTQAERLFIACKAAIEERKRRAA